ncbi:Uncharacterised protein [Klebsiella pneumoniae]|nr:Uncharacterised protein [Klebsiella pneumoniae]
MELSGDLSGRLRCKNYQPYLLTTRLRCFRRRSGGGMMYGLCAGKVKQRKVGLFSRLRQRMAAGICGKPRIKCSDCSHRQLFPYRIPLSTDILAGEHTIGVYPLLEDDFCYFLAVDFDEAEWQADASAFMQSCDELDVPATLEVSRSRQGAHIWVFFASRVLARDARRLG